MLIFDCCGWCKYYNIWKEMCTLKAIGVSVKNPKCNKFIDYTEEKE